MTNNRCTIVLVRHAQPFMPEPGGPGDYERSLTLQGLSQAEKLATGWAMPEPALIVSSPYLRAIQTVEPLARSAGLPVHTDPDLREWESGLSPTPDYARHYAASWANPSAARPNAESLHELTVRATTVLRSLAGEHSGVIVVVGSHGTFVSRALLGFGSSVDWPFCAAMPMPAIYRLHITEDQVVATGPGLPGKVGG